MRERERGWWMRRRQWIGATAASCVSAWFSQPADAQPQPQSEQPSSARVALLVGNRDYPEQMDLPPMHTNVRRMQAALEALDFKVTSVLDMDRTQAINAATTFATQLKRLPEDGLSFFYFCGHGMQVDAENFLLPAKVYPRELALKPAMSSYVALWSHVLEQFPRRPAGLSVTVIDACRTSPKPLSKDDGLNQVRAPDGELIVFSTGAGKPALTPIDETRMTFFTDALVSRLQSQARAPEEVSFPELFELVKADVQRTMLAHPVEDIRKLAQEPFVANSTRRAVRVSFRSPPPPPEVLEREKREQRQRLEEEEQQALVQLRGSLWPRDVVIKASDFEQRFPTSPYKSSVQVSRQGAAAAAKILADPEIGLSRQDFEIRNDTPPELVEDLRRAARGDKDAASRIGGRISSGVSQVGAAGLRFEAWMRYAGALGNGIAAYDLARHYASTGQAALSGQWVSRARKLGYIPPPGLRIGR